MAKLISLQIDVLKIDKSKLYVGKKGTYLDLTIAVNDEEDNYGNTVNCWQSQKQEDTTPKRYLMKSGKVVWSNENEMKSQSQAANKAASNINYDEDLPF